MKDETKRIVRVGMVGAGMIVEETYRPAFARLQRRPLLLPGVGEISVELHAIASRTGVRAKRIARELRPDGPPIAILQEPDSVDKLLTLDVDAVCVATPDDRHFPAAKAAINAGKHVLIEKPSVLHLAQLDELVTLARQNNVLAKVVYHKLLDPDHKRLRTLVTHGTLGQVHTGYCSLLEPKSIATSQFSEWIGGRNPGTYVAVHYIKLIDFTFGGRLTTISAAGQRGIVGPVDGATWDAVELRLRYQFPSGREAVFDIHANWVTPDNFPGAVEQEVQFRFENGVWNGHSRKRGVELCVENVTPLGIKTTLNNHYNAATLEPWGEMDQRGYGVEVIERFFQEVAFVEHGADASSREERLEQVRRLDYNDLAADRQVVASVQAMEAILDSAANGKPDGVVYVNRDGVGLSLFLPGVAGSRVLHGPLIEQR